MGAAGYAFAGLSLVGSGVSAIGTYNAGVTNQAIGNWNAELNELSARDAIEQGENAVRDAHLQARGLAGAQRAAIAGQGIELGIGTAADLIDDTAWQLKRETDRIRADAAREAWGHLSSATGNRMSARYAGAAGRSGAIGTILTGVGQAGGMAYQTYREG